jgi:hypothetical protein
VAFGEGEGRPPSKGSRGGCGPGSWRWDGGGRSQPQIGTRPPIFGGLSSCPRQQSCAHARLDQKQARSRVGGQAGVLPRMDGVSMAVDGTVGGRREKKAEYHVALSVLSPHGHTLRH